MSSWYRPLLLPRSADVALRRTEARRPGIQAGYTWSKSLDDSSAVVGGTGSTGALALTLPQNPFDTHPEKGPSSFDVAHAFSVSAAQDLHLQELGWLAKPRVREWSSGWELLSISTITSGSPFTIYSGIQQTGYGTMGADRPDQIGKPHLSTAHSSTRPVTTILAKYEQRFVLFYPGRLAGRHRAKFRPFRTLGRNTFFGPAYYDFDYALIKDTPFGHRKSGVERADLQFRSEFFNLFNVVNMGLAANTIKDRGSGDQQDCWDFAADPVFAEADLLGARTDSQVLTNPAAAAEGRCDRMRSGEGDAGKQYSSEDKWRASGARQGVRGPECGCTHHEENGRNPCGGQHDRSRPSGDPGVCRGAEKRQEQRQHRHANKTFGGCLKRIPLEKSAMIGHATCGEWFPQGQFGARREGEIKGEHYGNQDQSGDDCAPHSSDRGQHQRARACQAAEPTAPSSANARKTGVMTRAKSRSRTNNSIAWFARNMAPNSRPAVAPIRIALRTSERRWHHTHIPARP